MQTIEDERQNHQGDKLSSEAPFISVLVSLFPVHELKTALLE